MVKRMRNQYIDTTEDTDSAAYHQSSLAEDENVRRKRNLEMIMLELEIQEKRIKNLKVGLELLTDINPHWKKTDPAFREQIMEMLKDILLMPIAAIS